MTHFKVLSPDGIPIAPTVYATRDRAWIALTKWCLRYVPQGYYASVKGHIPLEELPARCTITGPDDGVRLREEFEVRELLEELAEYFDNRMDINADGGPNTAMTFHRRIMEVLG